MLLSALATEDDLPADYTERTAVLYEDVLGRLPELCDHIERHRDAWGDEDATLEASDAAFGDGQAVIEEHPDVDLAVVTVAENTPDAGGHRRGRLGQRAPPDGGQLPHRPGHARSAPGSTLRGGVALRGLGPVPEPAGPTAP